MLRCKWQLPLYEWRVRVSVKYCLLDEMLCIIYKILDLNNMHISFVYLNIKCLPIKCFPYKCYYDWMCVLWAMLLYHRFFFGIWWIFAWNSANKRWFLQHLRDYCLEYTNTTCACDLSMMQKSFFQLTVRAILKLLFTVLNF